MNHNYKLTDFRRLEDETEKDIINEPITIYLRSKSELPTELKVRLENTINNLITEYEQATLFFKVFEERRSIGSS